MCGTPHFGHIVPLLKSLVTVGADTKEHSDA